jgi:hypothetical protein
MAKLRNKILEKLASEGRISYLSGDEEQDIYKSTHKRITQYKQILAKREYYSHIAAEKVIMDA